MGRSFWESWLGWGVKGELISGNTCANEIVLVMWMRRDTDRCFQHNLQKGL